MGYYHVETVEPRESDEPFTVSEIQGKLVSGPWGHYTAGARSSESTNRLNGHEVWRCSNCRALAVTPYKGTPPKECGKCHT